MSAKLRLVQLGRRHVVTLEKPCLESEEGWKWDKRDRSYLDHVRLAVAVQLLGDDVRRQHGPKQAVLHDVLLVLLTCLRTSITALETRIVQVDTALTVRARPNADECTTWELAEFLLRV